MTVLLATRLSGFVDMVPISRWGWWFSSLETPESVPHASIEACGCSPLASAFSPAVPGASPHPSPPPGTPFQCQMAENLLS